MAASKGLLHILLNLCLARYVRNVAIDIRLRVRGVNIPFHAGFIRTVNECLCVLDDSVTCDTAFMIVEADPVRADHQFAAFDRSLDFIWFVESVGHCLYLKAFFFEGVRKWNILEVDNL